MAILSSLNGSHITQGEVVRVAFSNDDGLKLTSGSPFSPFYFFSWIDGHQV
jgi:hypothetical protein